MLASSFNQGVEQGLTRCLLLIRVSNAFASAKEGPGTAERKSKEVHERGVQRAHFLSGPFLPFSLFSFSFASCSRLALAAFASSSFTRLPSSCQNNMPPCQPCTLYVYPLCCNMYPLYYNMAILHHQQASPAMQDVHTSICYNTVLLLYEEFGPGKTMRTQPYSACLQVPMQPDATSTVCA